MITSRNSGFVMCNTYLYLYPLLEMNEMSAVRSTYLDTVHHAIVFIEIASMPGTTKPIGKNWR